MTEGTTTIPKVPSGIHKRVTKNRLEKIRVSEDYVVLCRVWIENKEILIL